MTRGRLAMFIGVALAVAAVSALIVVISGGEGFETTRSWDTALEFYGRVTDDAGRPVPGAEVALEVRTAHRGPVGFTVKAHTATTDEDGRFELRGVRGHALSVNTVVRKGYEYIYRPGHSYEYHGREPFRPDADRPIVFEMRTRNAPALVVPSSFGHTFENSEERWSVDLFEGRYQELGARTGRSEDLVFVAEKDPESKRWVLRISVPGQAGGVVETDGVLYTAPEAGYVRELEFDIEADSSYSERSFCVHARAASVYGALLVTTRVKSRGLQVSVKSWTSAEGSRNVEYDDDIYRKHIEDLKQERESGRRKHG